MVNLHARVGIASAAIVAVLFCASARVYGVALTDLNSTVSFQPQSASPNTDGMTSWTIDGVDRLQQQWFWYRIGDTGPQNSISSLNLLTSTASDVNDNPGDDTLYLKYGDQATEAGSSFIIEVNFNLSGGETGSDTSAIGELIQLTNKGSTRTFHFFQYSNFDLAATAGNDTLNITGGNTASQAGDLLMLKEQAETVSTPAPSHFQAGTSPELWNLLTGGAPVTLNNNISSTGDVAWAFQWDATIPTNDTVLISKVKSVMPVPEPASLALFSATGLLLLRPRRKA